MQRGRALGMLGLAVVAVLPLLAGCDPARSTVARPDDPVVMTGSALPRLRGRVPAQLVAFRATSAGAWQQVPVQVDERALVDFGVAPSATPGAGVAGTVYGTARSGVATLQYTDAGTFTGPDPDRGFDADDELVFMASDLGGLAPEGDPAGVVAGSGVQVTVTDPLERDAAGWLYLFQSAGSLSPSAGRSYVTYDFRLSSGDYRSTYRRGDGPNAEDSVVSTARYTHHFSDRWLSDRLTITTGGASRVDVLDRHKNLFAPDQCGRSEDTFNDAEGAFVVNKVGPVRALRSYVGANSGPLTQRTHAFYAGRQDVAVDLRVHAISSVMDFFDYSPAASGMRYANDRNPGGVPVDGQPDSNAAGRPRWELLAGPQGSLVHVSRLETNVATLNDPASATGYYLDDATPPVVQCTGDATAYASSGSWITRSIPDTDPRSGSTNRMRSVRSITYLAPGTTAATADLVDRRWSSPLRTAVENRA